MKFLCIAPAAPPLNQAESIQIYRTLKQLLATDYVDLVAERPFGTWSQIDPSLELGGHRLRRLDLALPLHDLSMRVIGHRFARPFAPLLDHWLALHASNVLEWSTDFDCIYSRSFPNRAALLGRALKRRTGKPWIMHLSDPWAGVSEMGNGLAERLALFDEKLCIADADRVMVTTEQTAELYQRRYPALARKFAISPNVFPAGAVRKPLVSPKNGRLRLLFAGTLYGRRSVAPILDAMAAAPDDLRSRVHFKVAGNAVASEIARMKAAEGMVTYLGPVTTKEVAALQEEADVLVTIEPPRKFAHDGIWLMSKLMDYLPTGKPLLAVTPSGSVTDAIVSGKYGWSFEPSDIEGVAGLIVELVQGGGGSLCRGFATDLPDQFRVEQVVANLRCVAKELVKC